MEVRPWFKKLLRAVRSQKSVPNTPTRTVHEFPLSQPKQPPRKINQRAVRVRCRKILKKRMVGQAASTDPRFNHALRRKAVELAKNVTLTDDKPVKALCGGVSVERIDVDTARTYPDPDMHLS